MIHLWHWLLNFTGVNNGENHFATHMYNFWSGFGGGLIEVGLLGAIIAIYRHYVLHNTVVDYVRKKSQLQHKDDK